MDAPRTAWVGWVVEVCGSLRQAQGRLSGTRVGTPRTGGDRPTASEAWLLLAVWFDTGRRVRRPGSPRTGWGRRGIAPRIARAGWVLGALWFDTVFRGLQTGSPRTGGDGEGAPRIARKVGCCWLCGSTRPAERLWGGSPRTGWGRRRARTLGCWGLCGSTRPSEDCRSAHHERGGGRRLARKVGCCRLCGSTRPSEDSRSAHHERGGGRRLARKVGCCRLCGSTRLLRQAQDRLFEDSRSAHHERGGADDWLGRLGVGGCVVRHDSFDRLRTGSSKTPGRLTTNGVGPASLGRYWNVRSGVSRPGCRARPVGGGRLPRNG